MLPFLEVGHLPSSSSFYSAILQPLGLRYTPTGRSPADPPAVAYATTAAPQAPLFELRQVAPSRGRPLKASRLVLAASSPDAVDHFQASALRASRAPAVAHGPALLDAAQPPASIAADAHTRVKITDFDGNIMEVVYVPPPGSAARHGASTPRKTQSTRDEVSRILDWNYDVASSSPTRSTVGASNLAAAGRPARGDEQHPVLRRTVTSSVLEPDPLAAVPRRDSAGLSTSVVVGTLLGVAAGAAAGAALTYSIVKNDRAKAPRQEFDPPPFSRRATFPEQSPGQPGRFVEVERTVEKVRYPEARPPTHISRRSQADSPPRGHDSEAIGDPRGYQSSRPGPARAPSVRTPSEVTPTRKPLMLADADQRSYVSSARHSSAASRPAMTAARRGPHDAPDLESHVSARTHGSGTTIRAPPRDPEPPLLRPKPSSRVSTSTARVPRSSPAHAPSLRAMSRAGSHMSARNVPLPPSDVGSSHAGWGTDADSIAPSDSISCIGENRANYSY